MALWPVLLIRSTFSSSDSLRTTPTSAEAAGHAAVSSHKTADIASARNSPSERVTPRPDWRTSMPYMRSKRVSPQKQQNETQAGWQFCMATDLWHDTRAKCFYYFCSFKLEPERRE